jgi:hypothetical protein
LYWQVDKYKSFFPASTKLDSITYPDTSGTRENAAQTAYLKTKYDTVKKVSQLKLRNFNTPSLDSTLYEFPHFEDGGLSADGFYFNSYRSQYYIPFYNSAIIRYDELHNSAHVIHTIDQTPPSNIAVPTGNIYSMSSKAIIVNSTATADENYLYVLSYVLSEDAVKNNYNGPAIDVYNIKTGQYESSFRLPGYQGKPVLQLAKSADTLIAAYENNVLIFKLTNK